MKKTDIKLQTLFIVLSVMAVMSSVIGGYLYYSALRESSEERIHKEAQEYVKVLGNDIDSNLAWSLLSVKSLAGLKELKQALLRGDGVALAETNAILDHFRDVLKASVCYLMDRSGDTIASSNRGVPNSFMGKNYEFRSYFIQSMQGMPSVYMALGVTSKKRGIYFSHPVYGKDKERPLGVVVTKTSVEPIEKNLMKTHHGIVLLTDPHGVVFVSSRSDWVSHVLWKASSETISDIIKTRQFGSGPWDWTGMKLMDEDNAVDDLGTKYRVHQQVLANYPGWRLVYLHSHYEVMEKISASLRKSVGVGVVISCGFFGIIVFFLFIKANASILQRKKVEASLKKSEERYREYFEEDISGTYISSPEGQLIACNQEYRNIFGFGSTQQALDTPISKLSIAPDERVKFLNLLKKEKRVTGYEPNLKKIDGTPVYLLENASGVFDEDGNLKYIRGFLLDVTEQRKLENQLQQAQKMEAIGTLAGGIAHDFNNILFPVLGHTEILLQDIPEENPIHDRLRKIYAGAIRARDLVKQILTFSRQDSFELKTMKLQPIITEALAFIRSTIPTTIEIRQEISNNCGSVKADATQIHQIVMNLTTNAYHAMAETGGELKVSLKEIQIDEDEVITPDMSPGTYVCLIVADTGIGMDKELTGKIFDPFFTTKEKGKGTGMGLSVVHGIVTSMNGIIQTHSEPGKGTRFNVYFPMEKNGFEKQNIQAAGPISVGGQNILLVDDEEDIVTMEKQMLERLGYQVASRTGSIEALEAFRAAPDKFDMVITDMAMPNMPGDRLVAELIKIRPDIPILLCTGFSETMSEERAASMGIKGFLMKPIVIKDLAQKMHEVLDNGIGVNLLSEKERGDEDDG